MHRCRPVGAVGMRLEPAAAIDENRNGTPDSNLIARSESRTNSLGPDGSVWIIELRANRIGRLNESFEEYEVPRDNPMLSGLAVASDGVVWFAMLHSSSLGRLAGSIFSGCPEMAHDRAALQSMPQAMSGTRTSAAMWACCRCARPSRTQGTAPLRWRLSDTTRPSFRTSCRRRTLVMSSSGLAPTTIRSASSSAAPGCVRDQIIPDLAAGPRGSD